MGRAGDSGLGLDVNGCERMQRPARATRGATAHRSRLTGLGMDLSFATAVDLSDSTPSLVSPTT